MLDTKRKQALVWDPVTGDQHRIALPPQFGAGSTVYKGAVLRAAGDVHFQVVVLVVDGELQTRVLGCVYSSETGLWGNLISTLLTSTNVLPHEYCGLSQMTDVLVGHSLYLTLVGDFPGILELDLEMQSLAVIPLPMDMLRDFELTAMRAESGGLGFLLFSKMDLDIQLWKRKTDCDGVASWELGRTIKLDNILPLNSVPERMAVKIFGFAECNNAVFLLTRNGIFMVHLESLESKRFLQAGGYCLPFESVYAAGT